MRVPADQPGLPGLDEGAALFEAWARLFDKDPKRIRYGPAAQRAAKRALKEADYGTCLRALEGAREWRRVRPGATGFTDIFGTWQGTGDLHSRINFFAEYAEQAATTPASTVILGGIPSSQHAMVRERQRHVEAMLKQPDNQSRKEPGELARKWLADTVGLYAELVPGPLRLVRWERR